MPLVDPTLAPSYGGPQQQTAQSIAALVARVAALERQRNPVFTPINLDNLNPGVQHSQDFTWFGGRLWVVLGGWVTFTSGSTGGFNLQVNGTTAAFGTATDTIPAGGVISRPIPMQVLQVDTTSWTPGTRTVTAPSINGNATSEVNASALLIEWPSA